eukprot:TRINITY_DN23435_c0_g1_i1.p1 TRINITY_DN23435_c0_g1~~TRINITY_DN23435_c0_g1_i1.p1  ORF type:complete len:550 (-),score=114.78 TRINITY_DN23435_c0_g1_i1:105-1658(-)
MAAVAASQDAGGVPTPTKTSARPARTAGRRGGRHKASTVTTSTGQPAPPGEVSARSAETAKGAQAPAPSLQSSRAAVPSVPGLLDPEQETAAALENAVTQRLLKTKMCYFFERGKCASQTCRYAHSSDELRKQPNLQKTKLCKVFAEEGSCSNGRNCVFAHGEAELRVTDGIYKTQMCHFFLRGRCLKGERCNHAHGPEDMRQGAPKSPQDAVQGAGAAGGSSGSASRPSTSMEASESTPKASTTGLFGGSPGDAKTGSPLNLADMLTNAHLTGIGSHAPVLPAATAGFQAAQAAQAAGFQAQAAQAVQAAHAAAQAAQAAVSMLGHQQQDLSLAAAWGAAMPWSMASGYGAAAVAGTAAVPMMPGWNQGSNICHGLESISSPLPPVPAHQALLGATALHTPGSCYADGVGFAPTPGSSYFGGPSPPVGLGPPLLPPGAEFSEVLPCDLTERLASLDAACHDFSADVRTITEAGGSTGQPGLSSEAGPAAAAAAAPPSVSLSRGSADDFSRKQVHRI